MSENRKTDVSVFVEAIAASEVRIAVLKLGKHTAKLDLRSMGAVRCVFFFPRDWKIPFNNQEEMIGAINKIRAHGIPFLGAGPGWHPSSILADLRERGLISGSWKEVVWEDRFHPIIREV
jgi:hypothetical protein